MKAVFLDRNTFSSSIDLAAPNGISVWEVFDKTENSPEAIAKHAADADIIITNKCRIDAQTLALLPKLKLVQITATGTDNVDLQACAAQNVVVQNVAGYTGGSVTEHTWAGILAAMRGLKPYHQAVTSGEWQCDGRFSLNELPIIDVAGKVFGVIGTGSIGRATAAVASAFGMEVLFAERKGASPRDASFTPFETVLAESDIVLVQCPLTDDSFHLIDEAALALMQKRPLLVNMARGAVINGAAVAKAVTDGRLFGLVCDVFAQEPPPADDPLLAIANHPRVILTPHNAWASVAAQTRLWKILCENVAGFIAHQGAS